MRVRGSGTIADKFTRLTDLADLEEFFNFSFGS
jgi:hypothetical protein